MDNFDYSQNEPIIYAINLTEFKWRKWLMKKMWLNILHAQINKQKYIYLKKCDEYGFLNYHQFIEFISKLKLP
jgi:hypothetical protein